MNATQVRYARDRAASIRRDREQALSARRYPKSAMTDKQKVAALRAGNFVVSAEGSRWQDRIVFNGEPVGLSADAYSVEYKKLQKEYTDIVDALVLGDAEEALTMLRKFAAAE